MNNVSGDNRLNKRNVSLSAPPTRKWSHGKMKQVSKPWCRDEAILHAAEGTAETETIKRIYLSSERWLLRALRVKQKMNRSASGSKPCLRRRLSIILIFTFNNYPFHLSKPAIPCLSRIVCIGTKYK